jgi:hypothetical protein
VFALMGSINNITDLLSSFASEGSSSDPLGCLEESKDHC